MQRSSASSVVRSSASGIRVWLARRAVLASLAGLALVVAYALAPAGRIFSQDKAVPDESNSDASDAVASNSDDTPPPSPHIVLTNVRPDSALSRSSLFNFYGLSRSDLRMIVDEVEGLERVIAVRAESVVARRGDHEKVVQLVGVGSQLGGLPYLPVSRGRFLNEDDHLHRRNVAAIGSQVAKELFPGDDPIGKTLRVEDNYFLVVGQADEEYAPERTTSIYVPLSTMRVRLGDFYIGATEPGERTFEYFELTRIELTLEDSGRTFEIETQIAELLSKSHSIEDYSIQTEP